MPPVRKPSLLDHAVARHHFSKAARHYDDAAVIQREIADRLFERLSLLKLHPKRLIDIGCGTGYSLPALHHRYPQTEIWALDFALPMLKMAQQRLNKATPRLKRWFQHLTRPDRFRWIEGDLKQLPLQTASMDLLFSNLALQWSADCLPDVFAEWHRALAVNGAIFFSTLGPDTLKEVREAFATVETTPHIHRFVDMHDIGDELVHAGFADPVMEMEKLTVRYTNPKQLFIDLKTLGALNADRDRSRGLMGKTRWQRLLSAWEKSGTEGQWNVTYEVVYGHAWKIAPKLPEGMAPIKFYSNPR